MVRCPYCTKGNQASASFCIHCGEPLDADSLSLLAVRAEQPRSSHSPLPGGERPTPTGDAKLDTGLRGRLEILLGVGLLVAVLAFVLFSYLQQEEQSAHYRAGTEAVDRGDLERAGTEFAAAGGYLDSEQKGGAVREKIKRRDYLYHQALEAHDRGESLQAAVLLKELESIQPGYKGANALLEKARSANGVVLYRLIGEGEGREGIYMAWADGGEPRLLPHTNLLASVQGVSPDGTWVTYSVLSETGQRTLYLYNAELDIARELYLPSTEAEAPGAARFTPDKRFVWIEVGSVAYQFSLTVARYTETMYSSRTIPRTNYERDVARSLHVEAQPDGTTVLKVSERGRNELQPLATESGKVDGAVFNSDGQNLIYRVCRQIGPAGWLECSLRLANLGQSTPALTTLSTIPLRFAGDTRNNLDAEFTGAGRYVLIYQKYNWERETHLYNIATQEFVRLHSTARGGGYADIELGPLVWGIVPGIIPWSGANTLANTDLDQGGRGSLTGGNGAEGCQRVRAHWSQVTGDARYLVYMGGQDAGSGSGDYRVYALRVGWTSQGRATENEPPRQLLRVTTRPAGGFHSAYLLPDNHTLLSAVPPTPGDRVGLYAFDLSSGEAKILVPGATDLWYPGFALVQPSR